MPWLGTFRQRLECFEHHHPRHSGEIPISIKVRVNGGRFCRNCCPDAYRILDHELTHLRKKEPRFELEEHETGPEVIAYVALATAGVTLAKSVIDLVTTIIKTRSEGAKEGDWRHEPVTLIVRRLETDDTLTEERIMTHDEATVDVVRKALLEGCEKLSFSEKERTQRPRKRLSTDA